MKKILEKIISIIKRNPNYKIQGDYSLFQLFMVLYYRFFQLIRGLYYKIFIKSKGLVFTGRRVKIEHGYLIKAGKNLIIEDNIYINALSKTGLQVGDHVNLGRNSIIICSGVLANKGEGITIGNNSAIGSLAFLGGQGGITIGNDVIFGPGVRIFSENHNFDHPTIPIRLQGENRKGITIGDNCWIGSGVTILDGVTIGSGCVIAAGTVVSKSLPDNTVFFVKGEKNIKNRIS